jgi:multidrug resistance efflux pump
MQFKIDKRNYFLLAIWSIVALTLLAISFHYKSAADAIVAQVDPQRIAVSYQRAVKLQYIRVIPGQDVKKGDTLLEVERPDLLLDIEESEYKLKGLFIERQKTLEEYNNRVLSAEIDKHSKLFNLEQEITLLTNRISTNRKIIQNLAILEGTERQENDSLSTNNEVKLRRLVEEKNSVEKTYQIKIQKIEQERITEINLLDNTIDIRKKQLDLFNFEKSDLIKVSPVNGTIGNVFAQINELVKPYTTIITIYEANPTVIKAYVNERHRQDVIVGSKVLVESSNREYSIIGEIFEVGSRITDYPQRLIENKLQLFGQEVFISIPENNKFLNGEKVYVRLKSGK